MMMWWSNNDTINNSHPPLALVGLTLFLLLLLTTLTLSNNGLKLFTLHHGRTHRLAGLFHLCWLLLGLSLCFGHQNENDEKFHIKCLLYDIILGISGIITTLTASTSFPHKHILNRPGESGTLSNRAIVTQAEMVEHSFYQGVNLVQGLYLHLVTTSWAADLNGYGAMTGFAKRFGMLFLVTLPWTVRKRFPVNSFSANWKNQHHGGGKEMKKSQEMKKDLNNGKINNTGDNGGIRVGTEKGSKYLRLINGMYRFKKWQYVFYKHVILHGLNISIAITTAANTTSSLHAHDDTIPLPLTPQWRTFWLLLNTSYVMEFFLQSLVKRQVLTQRNMMVLNGLLMISASLASNVVLGQVKLEAALISLVLNFWNRGHDLGNTMVTFLIVHFGNQLLRI